MHGARTPTPADIAVIEGVMGLFDGRLGTGGFAPPPRTSPVLTDSPVVLVVDVRHVALDRRARARAGHVRARVSGSRASC